MEDWCILLLLSFGLDIAIAPRIAVATINKLVLADVSTVTILHILVALLLLLA